MKKKFKQILSALLVAVMLVGIAPVGGINLSVKSSAMDLSSYKVGDLIEFGSYPQSEVKDSDLISKIEAAGASISWIDYNYYAGTGNFADGNMKPVKDMMLYKDITYKGNKYRAVKINQYRPYYTYLTSSAVFSQQDDNGYYTGNTYYFKFEPIIWRVLDPTEGYVMCSTVIDSQAYQNFEYRNEESEDYEFYNSRSCENFASDWSTSSLRKWLDCDFYNTAFSMKEKRQIEISHNETKSVFNAKYDSIDTYDKIFVISFDDAMNTLYGLGGNYSILGLKGTDYASCQGSWIYSPNPCWWLRTPENSSDPTGVTNQGSTRAHAFQSSPFTANGVVPAFKFNPKSTISESILTFADDPALCVENGKSINLRFALTKDGGESLYDGWSQPALTVSDKTVISVSNMTEKDSVYSVTVKGLKIGQSTLVVTDPQTGTATSLLIKVKDKYAKTYTYAIDKMKEFYPDNKYEKDIKTNIYNQHGIYVNNYSAKYAQKKDAYTVSLKAFNSQYLSGAVDIFDKNGNWIGSEEIKHRSSISSLKDTAIQGFYLIADWGTGKMITYEQHSFSEESDISFEVPNGGYFTISNNFAQSFGTFLYNSTEILLNGIKSVIDGAKGDKNIDAAELVKEAIEKDETKAKKINDIIDKTLSKVIDKQIDNYIDLTIEQKCEGIANVLIRVMDAADIDFKDAISVALGVSESKLLKAFGPAGIVLKSCFAFAESTDMVAQVEEIAKSINAEYTTVVTSLDNGYVNDNGISVITNGNVDKEAVLQTFRVSSSDVVETFLNPQNPYEQSELYNICFVKDDKYVQPNGKVTVEIPAPENMKGDSCKVYRQEKDGKWTVLQAYRKGNYICFDTDHFSMYALVYEKNEPEIAKLPNKLNYTVGQAIDLSGMVLKLNEKEITSGFMSKDNLAYKSGKQTVTVLYGDSEVNFDINVREPKVKSVSVSDITMNYKKSTTITPSITADDGAKYTVTYSSSNAKVATVDQNGKVYAAKKGSTTITCTVTDSNGNTVQDTCKVTVKYSFGQWLIKILLFGWIWY